MPSDACGQVCVVSEETFYPSVRAATDYTGPDWARRGAALRALRRKGRKWLEAEL